MPGYSVDVRDLMRKDKQRYHQVTRGVADVAADENNVTEIQIKALSEKVKGVEGFEELDIDTSGWIDRRINIGKDETEVVSRMFGDGLMKVIYFSGDEAIYARYPDGQVYARLPRDAADEIADSLIDRERLRRVEDEISGVAETDMTEGVLQALMEETPEDEETTSRHSEGSVHSQQQTENETVGEKNDEW